MDDIDPRLTDEELLASFTPKQREFHRWHEKTALELRDTVDDRVYRDRLRERFSTPEEREELHAWATLWLGRFRRRMNYRVPVPEFIGLIQNTNFRNPNSIAALTWKMEMAHVPFIFLGSSRCGGKSTGYGIRPGGHYLWPNLGEGPYDVDVLGRNVLGINFNVAILPRPLIGPSRRFEARSSGDDSVDSTESDDSNHKEGFAFVQIGALHVFGGDWEPVKNSSVDSISGHTWQDTGFGVVVEVGAMGNLGAVWVIWGAYAPDHNDASQRGERMPILDDGKRLLPDVGKLYHASRAQFMVARIADNVEALKSPRRDFAFVDQITDRECQLVQAKLAGVNRQIMRQYINRSKDRAYMYC